MRTTRAISNRLRLWTALGLAGLLWLGSVGSGLAYHSLDFHWGPSTLTISVQPGPKLRDAAEWAAYVWDVNDWPRLSVTDKNYDCDRPPIGVVTICYADNHDRSHIHVFLGRDGHSLRGTIHMSPSDAAVSTTRMRGTICQEIGHALGLDHRHEGSGCMLTANNPSPDSQDYRELRSIYDHPVGFDHWHKGRRHIHRVNHCHPYLIVFCENHEHEERHWHEGRWHHHDG